VDRFDDVVAHLAGPPPGTAGADLDLVALTDVHVLNDKRQRCALWFSSTVCTTARSGDHLRVPADELFTAAMLAGGYRKKYFRAVSRLVALTPPGRPRGRPQPQ
jgi:cell division protein ZapE